MNPNIDKIIVLVHRAAQDARVDAGMTGRWDDGGAGSLEMQIEFFNYGRHGITPPSWSKFAQQAAAEADPDYAKYIELRKKFG